MYVFTSKNIKVKKEPYSVTLHTKKGKDGS